jgi:hypothetical protein
MMKDNGRGIRNWPVAAAWSLARLLVVFSLICFLHGCSRPPEPGGGGRESKDLNKPDPLASAMEVLRNAGSTVDIKEGLHLVDLHLQKEDHRGEVQLSKENLAALERFCLDKDELSDVQAADFRAADAYHVEQCFLLRDVARTIEVPDDSRVEQAGVSLDWVGRQVLLREGVDRLVPPHYVLKRGYGTARERALVFVALLQQFEIPACVLAWPATAAGNPRTLLVGVLGGDKESDIYLFDPRLGRPVPGPGGKGTATLAELRKHPELFDAAVQDKKAEPEVLLACPLEAVSPRMKFLETQLAVHDKVSLAIEPASLYEQVTRAAGDKVAVWNAPVQAGALPDSPVRMLRQFLPAAEGGSDTSGRLMRLEARLFPADIVMRNYASMRLLGIHSDIDKSLLVFSHQMFMKFAQTPRDLLLHGQFKNATKRLIGIRQVFENEEMAQPLGDEEIAGWRAQARTAFLALEQHQPNGPELVDKLWKGDQFLMILLQAQDDPDLKKHKKTALSSIVLKAVREPLVREIGWLVARSKQEETDRASRRGRASAKEDWQNVAAWWRKYLERNSFDPASLPARLSAIRSRWPQAAVLNVTEAELKKLLVDYELAWDQLWTEMHRAAAARLLQARALELRGNATDVPKKLDELKRDLAALRENAELRSELATTLQKAQNVRSPELATFLEGLLYDLGPAGGFAALQQQTQLSTRKE